jgi:hypothetical protein
MLFNRLGENDFSLKVRRINYHTHKNIKTSCKSLFIVLWGLSWIRLKWLVLILLLLLWELL